MYRLFLAIRYLLTRPINLLGMGGIAIGVWALVVVVSLFSGFLQVIEEHVQASCQPCCSVSTACSGKGSSPETRCG